jgi:hypothetical protein
MLRDTANESRYDGSRRHNDKLVIPLLVSGIYPRRHDVEPTLAIETKRRITMSTIILSSIFGQAGSIFGPIGQIIGSELGALLGAQLDGACLY